MSRIARFTIPISNKGVKPAVQKNNLIHEKLTRLQKKYADRFTKAHIAPASSARQLVRNKVGHRHWNSGKIVSDTGISK